MLCARRSCCSNRAGGDTSRAEYSTVDPEFEEEGLLEGFLAGLDMRVKPIDYRGRSVKLVKQEGFAYC